MSDFQRSDIESYKGGKRPSVRSDSPRQLERSRHSCEAARTAQHRRRRSSYIRHNHRSAICCWYTLARYGLAMILWN